MATSDTYTYTIKEREIAGLLDGKLTPSLRSRIETAVANAGPGRSIKLVVDAKDEVRLQEALEAAKNGSAAAERTADDEDGEG
jgi:hypothetical protein